MGLFPRVLAASVLGLYTFVAHDIVANKDMEAMMDKVKEEIATFAGGCFWCTEAEFEEVRGVTKAICGYTGGRTDNPTYEQVCTGETGHMEAVRVHFDPSVVSYEELLQVFWRHIDPTDSGGQFADRGSQYKTAIFYHDEEQKEKAEMSRAALEASGRFHGPIVTEIKPAERFYEAEPYHQDYHKTCSLRYRLYRIGSGRDGFIEKVWGKAAKSSGKIFEPVERGYKRPTGERIKGRLTPLQFHVTQQCGTEEPFSNEYWDEKREGIYVDIVSGEPLFSSLDKFDSGTGWPSFKKPIESTALVEREDRSAGITRIEVRSRIANSHLGHVFSDGPEPTGLRYCINSAALRFIPKEDLEKEGYGRYLELFEKHP